MNDTDEEGFEINEDDFKEVMEKFKKKKTRAYDFILKSSEEYQEAIYGLCKLFIDEEAFPHKFRKTVLHMISKKEGLG